MTKMVVDLKNSFFNMTLEIVWISYEIWQIKYNHTVFSGVFFQGVLPYSLGGGVLLGLWKSYPLLDQILQILWPYTRLKMLNCSWFQSFVSNPIKQDPITM